MKQIVKSLAEMIMTTIAKCKIYISRTTGYLGILNTGMLLYLLLVNLKDKGYIEVDLNGLFFPLVVFCLIAFLTIGWIETRFFKGLQKEATFGFSLSPPMVEMSNKISYVYDKEVAREEALK